MTITEGMPRRAFNLLPKCNESGQKSGHRGLYQKWEEICKWFIISCGDSSVTHVKMTLSWELKGIRRHLYFPNVDGKWERGSNWVRTIEGNCFIRLNLEHMPFQLISFHRYTFCSDLFLKNQPILYNHTVIWIRITKALFFGCCFFFNSNKIVVNKSKKDHISCIIWFINMCMPLTKLHSTHLFLLHELSCLSDWCTPYRYTFTSCVLLCRLTLHQLAED